MRIHNPSDTHTSIQVYNIQVQNAPVSPLCHLAHGPDDGGLATLRYDEVPPVSQVRERCAIRQRRDPILPGVIK